MGYVHDIYLDLDCDRTAFAAAVADIRTLFRRAELPIAGPAGRPGTTPVLDDDFIGFNGISSFCTCDPGGPDYHGFRSCQYTTCRPKYFDNNCGQPFVIDLKPDRPYGISQMGGRYWIDCKTFRRPYDQAVMLAMIALKASSRRSGGNALKGQVGHQAEPWRRCLGLVGGPEATRPVRHLYARVP